MDTVPDKGRVALSVKKLLFLPEDIDVFDYVVPELFEIADNSLV